jgi:hypothetical protein
MGQAENGREPVIQVHAEPATPPDGYDEWLFDLYAVAQEGEARLKAVWAESRKELRQHLTTTNKAEWESIKAKAAGVHVETGEAIHA